jgi:hypothetical protein
MPTADVRWFTTPDGTRLALYCAGAGHMVQLKRAEQVVGRIGELVTAVEANRRWGAE